MQESDFSYCLTSELHYTLRFKLLGIKGRIDPPLDSILLQDSFLRKMHSEPQYEHVYITCQPFADGKPLCLPIRTGYRHLKDTLTWDEWIVFPIEYAHLPLSTQIAITLWDCYSPRKPVAIGGTTFKLFGKHKTIRRAKHRLKLWNDTVADPYEPTKTPSKINDLGDLDRLEKLMRKYHRGDIPKIDWLDDRIEQEIQKLEHDTFEDVKGLYLYINLPIFDFPLVFNEPEYTYPEEIHLRELDHSMVTIFDPEIFQENPVENKHRKLARSHRTGPLDRELKPNAKLRDEINDILRYPPTKQLADDEKDLLWKFRFYLTRDKKALTKFLKCVVWKDPVESKQAVELLQLWISIDVEDALELLSPEFKDRNVREFAVLQLDRADNNELQLYLLQLVQAIKFEKMDSKTTSPLVEFLIKRGLEDEILGNYLHWYLMVECEDAEYGRMFGKVAYQFLSTMVDTPDGINKRDNLRRQGELIATLSKLSRDIRNSKEARPRKIEKLREYIAEPKNGLLSFPPISLPLDPTIQVTGLVPQKANVFKSALSPLFLTFTKLDGSEYQTIFKTGDDLRQDQLVVQIISLMDRLLRKENLDLHLTPYKVLATGIDHGMLQFVPSKAIASILYDCGNSLVPYLSKHPNSLEIDRPVMDKYIRSTAGYSVMTYLLGIGDRHLDNLLLTPQGHLFHIDFGYMLGRDPKPFPPPMKLCKEMIDVLGGASTQHYNDFRSFCFIAYNSLRKSANLILNLFSLMVDASITDIALEPDKTVQKVQDRFRLDLTDEEAIQYFQQMINESIGAYFPQVMEQLHKVAQMFRS